MAHHLEDCEFVFTSKEQVQAYFQSFFGKHGSGVSPKDLKERQKTDVGFLCRNGGSTHTYLVTLAKQDDIHKLLELEEEFVRDHKELFKGEKQFKDVTHDDWFLHVGLSPESSVRTKILQNFVKKNEDQAKHFSSLGQCFHRAGCILKCVKFMARTSVVAGFLHFALADNNRDEQRSSKRLKRRRGEDTGEYVKVSHLLVSKDYRGRGVGALLLASMMHRVNLCDQDYLSEVFLTVIKRNEPAVALYKSLGFEIVGTNEEFLGKGDKRKVEWCQMQIKERLNHVNGKRLNTKSKPKIIVKT
eukprot:gnl/MRDRNA2_/MRDRNA2_93605_c0_seq1.p1 gnl/MRDRNA2_/MRDRNA2_93605_c0~~gnl/MRDRNA2_/MRDRNA2_93605_c0_seq1.p1  ORF type:complete len:301 (-),score=56.24 gnl/MRDRNA2_/MRDRNA2_93605_c0_seq1:16-918(-)